MTRIGLSVTVLFIFLVSLAILGALVAQSLVQGGFVSLLTGAVAGALVAVLIALGAIFIEPINRWLGDFQERNRILLVGLQRSGKTSIIRQILRQDVPRQERSTERFDVYDEEIKLELRPAITQPVSIADYRGQKISQITVNYPVQFFGRRGDRLVNAIVFVADLFPELVDAVEKPLEDEELVQGYESDAERRITKRVEDHLEYLTRYTVEQVFSAAFSKRNLFAVRLLINKIDLLREVVRREYLPGANEGTIEEYATRLFMPISREIQRACEINEVSDFSVHIVSAKTGENLHSAFGGIFETYYRRDQQ